jgi:hypothetical protein
MVGQTICTKLYGSYIVGGSLQFRFAKPPDDALNCAGATISNTCLNVTTVRYIQLGGSQRETKYRFHQRARKNAQDTDNFHGDDGTRLTPESGTKA